MVSASGQRRDLLPLYTVVPGLARTRQDYLADIRKQTVNFLLESPVDLDQVSAIHFFSWVNGTTVEQTQEMWSTGSPTSLRSQLGLLLGVSESQLCGWGKFAHKMPRAQRLRLATLWSLMRLTLLQVEKQLPKAEESAYG